MKQLILQAADLIDQINTSPIPYPDEHLSAYITVCKKVGMYYLFCQTDIEKYINYLYMAIAMAPDQPSPNLMMELLEPKVLFLYGVAMAAATDPVALFDLEKINRALASFWSSLDSQTALTYFTKANTCMQKAHGFARQVNKNAEAIDSQRSILSRNTILFFMSADNVKPISGVARYASSPAITRV